jgi:hypothetical protein
MKIMNLAMPSALVTTLLAGCVMEPGDEQVDAVDAVDADQLSPADMSESAGAEPAGAEAAALARPLDARAAAAAEAQSLVTGSSTPASLATFFTGSMAAGATQHWVWNNAPSTIAFQVGLSPVGASTASPCTFEVTRTWDVQKPGGEREFHFYVKNISAITCGANILLDSKSRVATWATGGLDVGASKSWTWNNANPVTSSFFVGIAPSGATSTTACELEVTRSWYAQQPGGEREFKFTVKNVGGIACQGDVQLAMTSSLAGSWSTGALDPAETKTGVWNNANPLDRIYVPGLWPTGASGLAPCVLEVTRSYYRQVIDTDGTAERKFYVSTQNIGSLACTGAVLLNYMD